VFVLLHKLNLTIISKCIIFVEGFGLSIHCFNFELPFFSSKVYDSLTFLGTWIPNWYVGVDERVSVLLIMRCIRSKVVLAFMIRSSRFHDGIVNKLLSWAFLASVIRSSLIFDHYVEWFIVHWFVSHHPIQLGCCMLSLCSQDASSW
jgi:hypothetical protein